MGNLPKTKYNITEGNLSVFINKSEDGIVWIDAAKRVIPIGQLSDNHLYNIIDWLRLQPKSKHYLNRTFQEWENVMISERYRRANVKEYKQRLEVAEKRLKALDNDLLHWEREANKAAKGYEATLDARRQLSRSIEATKKEWGF